MRKKIRRAISALLAAVMIITAMPAFALSGSYAAYGVTQKSGLLKDAPPADRVASAVEKFTEAVSK